MEEVKEWSKIGRTIFSLLIASGTELFPPFNFLFLLISPVTEIENEHDLYKKAIIRAYARRSALLEPKAIEPSDPALDDNTLQEGSQIQNGELTDEVYSFPFFYICRFWQNFAVQTELKVVTNNISGRKTISILSILFKFKAYSNFIDITSIRC